MKQTNETVEKTNNELSVLANKDHENAVRIQKDLGITMGTMLTILGGGRIFVRDENDAVKEVNVTLDLNGKAWVGADGTAYPTNGHGVSYTIDEAAMNTIISNEAARNRKALADLVDFANARCSGALRTNLLKFVNDNTPVEADQAPVKD